MTATHGPEQLSSRVFRFQDTCNVYVVTAGRRALLIDFGSGGVLDHLADIGIDGVDWVLHTHHHRDQCQGHLRVAHDIPIAVPAHEAELFAAAEATWRSRRTYDLYDCSSETNALARSVDVSRRLADYEAFSWADVKLLALPSPGHTRGSLSYVGEIDGTRYAFTGDLVHSPGRVWTLHDLQWDYVEPDALNVAIHSVATLRARRPDRVAPSHGDVMNDGDTALGALEANLGNLYRLLGRGYSDAPELPRASASEVRIVPVSEHLLTVTSGLAHFHVLVDDRGHALFFDYGFASWDHAPGGRFRFVEHSLRELAEIGIEHVDVVVPTHYHDDHVAGIPFLQAHFGTEVWAHEVFADILEQPARYRLPCIWRTPIPVSRTISEGAALEWSGYRFTARHNPGHTEYAAAYFGVVDGRRVAIVGDELERDGFGHLRGSGPIYRNRVAPESFGTGIKRIIEFDPDILLTGHNGALEVDKKVLAPALKWANDLTELWRELAAEPDAMGLALDPDLVSLHPYRAQIASNETLVFDVTIRNPFEQSTKGRVDLLVPAGWQSDPTSVSVNLEASAVVGAKFEVSVPDCPPSMHVVTADVELGGRRLGELAEALVTVR